jgi:hypothetical protein
MTNMVNINVKLNLKMDELKDQVTFLLIKKAIFMLLVSLKIVLKDLNLIIEVFLLFF